jgi:hypothetical protein
MFFSQDWRERIKTENPDAGFGESCPIRCVLYITLYVTGEVGKLLGAKWKELDEEEKKASFAATVGTVANVNGIALY